MASINQLASGKWRVQIRVKGHKPQTRSFPSKSAAQLWARNTEAKIHLGQVSDFGESFNVESLLNTYADKITPRKKSRRQELSRIRVMIGLLGHIDVRQLTPSDVIDYVDERLESVVSDTVVKELNTLSHAIVTGMALWGLVMQSNPVVTARSILSVTQSLTPGQRRDRRLRNDEEAELLDSEHGDLFAFALETAMRRGEIAVAKPEHRSADVLAIPDTKTGKARTIPLSARAIAILDKLEEGGGTYFGMRPDSISQAFIRACAHYGIEGLRFHDLRHEATSRLFERGWSIEEVSVMTGHADWRSLKRYTHLNPSDLAKKLQDT